MQRTAPASATPLEARDATWVGILLALFVLPRLLWLGTTPETASYFEELYRWTAIHELLTAPVQPLLDYQADHYQGGSLLMIALGMPLVWLGGESIFTFKLTALVFSTSTLALLYLLCRRFFGRPVAVFASLGYIAGPPILAFWGLVVMGSHTESILWSLLQVFVFLGLLNGEWRSRAGWAVMGLSCGLGIWFAYTSAISALACGLTWLVLQGFPRPREIAAATLGLTAGLLPWLVYNGTHDFAGFGRVLEVFGLRPAVDPWPEQDLLEKFSDLFLRVLPVGLLDPSGRALPPALRPLLVAGFATPMALGLGAGLVRAGRALHLRVKRQPAGERSDAEEQSRRELVFHVYLLVFITTYLASRFTVDPSLEMTGLRLFPPFAVLALPPVAISLARGLAGPSWLRTAGGAAALVCLACTAFATTALALRPADRDLLDPGLGYTARGILDYRKHEPELLPAIKAVRRIRSPADRVRALEGVGWGIQHRFELRGSLEDIKTRLGRVPPGERMHVIGGMRWGARIRIAALVSQPPRSAGATERNRLLARLRAFEAFAEAERQALAAAGPAKRDPGDL